VLVPDSCRAGGGEFSSRGDLSVLSRGQLSVLRKLSAARTATLQVITQGPDPRRRRVRSGCEHGQAGHDLDQDELTGNEVPMGLVWPVR
jgi:hypothetical protein